MFPGGRLARDVIYTPLCQSADLRVRGRLGFGGSSAPPNPRGSSPGPALPALRRMRIAHGWAGRLKSHLPKHRCPCSAGG